MRCCGTGEVFELVKHNGSHFFFLIRVLTFRIICILFFKFIVIFSRCIVFYETYAPKTCSHATSMKYDKTKFGEHFSLFK